VIPTLKNKLNANGEGRVSADTHGPRATKKHAAEPQVQPEQPAFPAQWFYGLYVISGDRAFLPPSVVELIKPSNLSASLGAPGPHDFAVRCSIIRLLTLPRPSHPAPNTRDDREAPLLRKQDRQEKATDLGSAPSGIFFRRRLDDPNQVESVR
jgi:hypothetical protein